MPLRKSEFITACIVEVLDEPGYFRLTQELLYYSARLGRLIIVPIGYKTNFASIPWFVQSLIQVNGRHRKAAVVHDYLCDHGEELGIEQRETDFIFMEAMEVTDTRATQRWVMFPLVRVFQAIKHTWIDMQKKLGEL